MSDDPKKPKTMADLLAELRNNPDYQSSNVYQMPDTGYGLEMVRADQVIARQQPWFWDGVIPLDSSTLFAGYGGIGKSQLLLFLAAHVSHGKSFTAGGDTHRLPAGSVLLLSGEDDPEYQIVPKLTSLGADLDKVYILKMMKVEGKPKQLLDLDRHLSLLEDSMNTAINAGHPVKLVVIDPVQYFTGDMKDHVNANVCRFVGALNEFAKKHSLAIIMNKHLRKRGDGSVQAAAADSVAGSAAWTTSPRSCWLIHPHPTDDNKILFADLKTNLKKKSAQSFTYQIEKASITVNNQHIETTVMRFHDKMEDLSADEALNAEKIPPVEQAIRQWIVDFLLECSKKPNNGAMFSSSELGKEAMAEGFSKTHYFRVRSTMMQEGIISEVLEGKAKKVIMVKLTDPEMYGKQSHGV